MYIVTRKGSLPVGYNSLEEAVKDSDLVVFAVPWKEFKEVDAGLLKQGAVLFDCWRMLDVEKYKEKVKYIGLGINY